MKIKLLILFISLLIFQNSFSQKTPIILDSITVKGRSKLIKERNEFKKNAQATEVLNSYDLNRNNPAFIEQSMNTMSGVQIDKRTQLGGQRIVIRGYGNEQKFNNWGIRVYYNNIPLTNADGVTILEDVDFSIVDNIEVIKGPASSKYGAGIGGTARFYLKTPTENGVSIEQKTSFGSYNLLQSQTRINSKTVNGSMYLNYGHLESDGYRPHGSGLKNFYTYLGDFIISKKEKLSLFLSQNNSYEQVSGQISYADYYAGIDMGNSAYIKKNAGNKFKTIRVGVTYENSFNAHFKNTTSVFYSAYDLDRIAAGAYEVSKNNNYGLRSVFEWYQKWNADWSNELKFGTELMQSASLISNYRFLGTDDTNPILVNDISKASYFDINNKQTSGFIEERIAYRPYDLSFIVGLSGNQSQYHRKDLFAIPGLIPNYNKDLSFDKKFATVFNPHIAIQKNYKNQVFNLSYSLGFNAPTAATSFITGLNQTNDGLKSEKAKMLDFSIHGLLFDTKFDYQIAVFDMQIQNKLTQLSAVNPDNNLPYTYWSNTGNQSNKGIEVTIGYLYELKNSFIKSIQPFTSISINDFKYKNFETIIDNTPENYKGNLVVGIPNSKYTLGLDFKFKKGIYFQNTFNHTNRVYTDFANTNSVEGFVQLNSKLGFQKDFLNKKFEMDLYFAGNNLTNAINYTFLFLGNNINDSDAGSNYPSGIATDVNPGPSKAYFFGGFSLKYHL